MFFQNFSDCQYITCATHEARCDEIDVIFDTEDDIVSIFLCNPWEVGFDPLQIDTFFVFQDS
ncbi:hypothetical protein D3C74_489250 [compost metagenome]